MIQFIFMCISVTQVCVSVSVCVYVCTVNVCIHVHVWPTHLFSETSDQRLRLCVNSKATSYQRLNTQRVATAELNNSDNRFCINPHN